MIMFDGTAWTDTLPLVPALKRRAEFGHEYRDESLEVKRQQAIHWLRTQSKKGWVCDKIIRCGGKS